MQMLRYAVIVCERCIVHFNGFPPYQFSVTFAAYLCRNVNKMFYLIAVSVVLKNESLPRGFRIKQNRLLHSRIDSAVPRSRGRVCVFNVRP